MVTFQLMSYLQGDLIWNCSIWVLPRRRRRQTGWFRKWLRFVQSPSNTLTSKNSQQWTWTWRSNSVLEYLITVHEFLPIFQFRMSHSIHVLSIQIETKNLDFIRSTTSNCPSLQAIWNRVLHCVSLVVTVGLLDTLLPLKRWSKLAL